MLACEAASTSSVPMMGPVHENDTSTSVKAMKNMLQEACGILGLVIYGVAPARGAT